MQKSQMPHFRFVFSPHSGFPTQRTSICREFGLLPSARTARAKVTFQSDWSLDHRARPGTQSRGSFLQLLVVGEWIISFLVIIFQELALHASRMEQRVVERQVVDPATGRTRTHRYRAPVPVSVRTALDTATHLTLALTRKQQQGSDAGERVRSVCNLVDSVSFCVELLNRTLIAFCLFQKRNHCWLK